MKKIRLVTHPIHQEKPPVANLCQSQAWALDFRERRVPCCSCSCWVSVLFFLYHFLFYIYFNNCRKHLFLSVFSVYLGVVMSKNQWISSVI